MNAFFNARRPHNGLPYDAYLAAWRAHIERPLAGLDTRARRTLYYARYNKERSDRVTEAYTVSDPLRAVIEAIDTPHLWMVLTEDWCLDSAYALPIIDRAAGLNSLIDLRILPRDDNLDIMDHFLTGTARSIPKLVAFAADGEEYFRWGPRPREAQRLRERLNREGVTGVEISKKLIEWFDDGGWRLVDDELTEALEGLGEAV